MRFLRFIALIVLSGFLFISCDKIEPPFTEKIVVPPLKDTIFKKVLLEEYTGFKCVNCPAASELADSLKHDYGERLIVMAVHNGSFAQPFPSGLFSYDFRTPAGDAWGVHFGLGSNPPKGMVNRIGYPTQNILNPDDWPTKIQNIILDSADANIEIQTILNETTKKLNVNIDAYFYTQLIGDYYVNVCLIEDSIIENQKMQGVGDVLDYNHMHALRGSISSIWGDFLVSNPSPDSANSISQSYTDYTISNYRDLKNCSVVAFIYRHDNAAGGKYGEYEIVQAEQKKLK
ncbi:MAG: Omp28-related outer membrane protein [Saprospiraceae bacterium]|nr:Omp28-related outer membrane protein [Saprospiraceae bacterium]